MVRPGKSSSTSARRTGVPYFANDLLDVTTFSESLGQPVGGPCPVSGAMPLPTAMRTGNEDEDEWADKELDSERGVTDETGNRADSSTPVKTKKYQNVRVTGGRPALPKKVIWDLDSDDEIIVSMKQQKATDKEVAEHLISEGRTRYNHKTISSRWIRLRRVLAEREDALLDDELTDWHEGEDELLYDAYDVADEQVLQELDKIRSKRWSYVAQHFRSLAPTSRYSQNACKVRYEELEAGTARIPPELDDDPAAREEERAVRQAAKAKERAEAEERALIDAEKEAGEKEEQRKAKAEAKASHEDEKVQAAYKAAAESLTRDLTKAEAQKIKGEVAAKIKAEKAAKAAEQEAKAAAKVAAKAEKEKAKAEKEKAKAEREAKAEQAKEAKEAKEKADLLAKLDKIAESKLRAEEKVLRAADEKAEKAAAKAREKADRRAQPNPTPKGKRKSGAEKPEGAPPAKKKRKTAAALPIPVPNSEARPSVKEHAPRGRASAPMTYGPASAGPRVRRSAAGHGAGWNGEIEDRQETWTDMGYAPDAAMAGVA